MLAEGGKECEGVPSAVRLADAQPVAEGEGMPEGVGPWGEGEAERLVLVLPMALLSGVAEADGEVAALPVSALDLLRVAGAERLPGALPLAHADARGVALPQAEAAPLALPLPEPLPCSALPVGGTVPLGEARAVSDTEGVCDALSLALGQREAEGDVEGQRVLALGQNLVERERVSMRVAEGLRVPRGVALPCAPVGEEEGEGESEALGLPWKRQRRWRCHWGKWRARATLCPVPLAVRQALLLRETLGEVLGDSVALPVRVMEGEAVLLRLALALPLAHLLAGGERIALLGAAMNRESPV